MPPDGFGAGPPPSPRFPIFPLPPRFCCRVWSESSDASTSHGRASDGPSSSFGDFFVAAALGVDAPKPALGVDAPKPPAPPFLADVIVAGWRRDVGGANAFAFKAHAMKNANATPRTIVHTSLTPSKGREHTGAVTCCSSVWFRIVARATVRAAGAGPTPLAHDYKSCKPTRATQSQQRRRRVFGWLAQRAVVNICLHFAQTAADASERNVVGRARVSRAGRRGVLRAREPAPEVEVEVRHGRA